MKMIKQLPATKRDYRGKNINGGRKCLWTNSKEYRKKATAGQRNAAGIASVASRWGS